MDSSIQSSPSSKSSSAASAAAKRRRQVKHACSACSKKHIKCNGKHPCHACVSTGQSDSCFFPEQQKRGPKPTESLQEYCQRLKEELEAQKQLADHWKHQYIEMMDRYTSVSQSESRSDDSPNILVVDQDELNENTEQVTIDELSAERAIEICKASIADITPFVPEVDIDAPSPSTLIKLFYMTQKELQAAFDASASDAVHLFCQSILGLSGAAVLGYLDVVSNVRPKVELLYQLMRTHDITSLREQPDVVRCLVGAHVIMWLYYTYDDDRNDRSDIIHETYRISSYFKANLTQSMQLRVSLTRLVVSKTLEDADFWYNQAASYSLSPENCTEITPESLFADMAYLSKISQLCSSSPDPSLFAARLSYDRIARCEHTLAEFEGFLGAASFILTKFPSEMHQQMDDALLTLRLASFAARAGVLMIMNRPNDALSVMDAFSALMQLTRPSLNICLLVVFAAVDISIGLGSAKHVAHIMARLNQFPTSNPSINRVRSKCVNFLRTRPLEETQDSFKYSSKFVINNAVIDLLEKKGLYQAKLMSPEGLTASISRGVGIAQQFVVSFQRICEALNNESEMILQQARTPGAPTVISGASSTWTSASGSMDLGLTFEYMETSMSSPNTHPAAQAEDFDPSYF